MSEPSWTVRVEWLHHRPDIRYGNSVEEALVSAGARVLALTLGEPAGTPDACDLLWVTMDVEAASAADACALARALFAQAVGEPPRTAVVLGQSHSNGESAPGALPSTSPEQGGPR